MNTSLEVSQDTASPAHAAELETADPAFPPVQLAHLPQPAALLDASGLVLQVNAAWWSFLGRPIEAEPEQALSALFPPALSGSQKPQLDALRLEALQARPTQPVDLCLQAAQGSVRHARIWLQRISDKPVVPGQACLLAVLQDIGSEQLNHEQALRAQDDLLRELAAILDGSPVGIAYLRGGRLVRCNRRFERMLDSAEGQAPGLSLQELLRQRQRQLHGASVLQALHALSNGLDCDVELELTHPEGGADGVDTSWYALSLRSSEPGGQGTEAVAVLSDITGLKRQQGEIERALVERELMFNQADVGIAWLRKGLIVRVNHAMSEMTGKAEPELIGRDMASMYAAGHSLPADSAMRRELKSKGRFMGELRLLHRDGSQRWVQVSVRALDPADADSDLVCSCVDVDERQRSREALQQQAARTRAMLDSVLVGIVTVGESGIEWMNRSARRMFGGELETFLGEPIGCVATPDPDHPLNRADWLTRLEEGESEIFECRLLARDGRTFWVVGNAVATALESSEGRQITFALLDIESRRQAEVQVSNARASLQRLIETAPLAIALFDAGTLQVVEGNRGAEVFFGRPLQQLLGAGPNGCLEDTDQAAALSASLQLARDTADGVRREITRPGPHQEPQRWDARFVALGRPRPEDPDSRSDDGSRQILLVANDVTELRRAEQARLDEAIAQRGLLVKEVHHRIKNNLQGVAGLLQLTAERRPDISVPLQEAISQVQAIAQVYGLQVGADGPLDLLGVLRAVAGAVQRSLHHLIEVALESRQAEFLWMLPEPESIPLALSLNELLTNAVRHGVGEVVSCGVRSSDHEVCIEIRNRGSLPAGFEAQRIPPGMSGLGLVRALLPRRNAVLELVQKDDDVVTTLTLRPPSVRKGGLHLRHNAPGKPPPSHTP